MSEKARILMTPVLGSDKTEALIARIGALERLADLRELRPFITR